MNRIKIFAVLILLAFITLFISKPILFKYRNTETIANKIGCQLFEFNRIEAECTDDIDLKKVIIKSENRIVFANGKKRARIPQDYGQLELVIYYHETEIKRFIHFRTNSWYTYDFRIEISKSEGNIFAQLSIIN